MPPLKILVIGAGVCGPAFAALLRRVEGESEGEGKGSAAYDITIIERMPGLRETGLQIDLRAQGIAIARKMGGESVYLSNYLFPVFCLVPISCAGGIVSVLKTRGSYM